MARRGRGKRTYKRRALARSGYRKGLTKPQAKAVRRIAKRVTYKLGNRVSLENAPPAPAQIFGDLKNANPLGFKNVTSTVSLNDLSNSALFFATGTDEVTGSTAWWTNTKVQLTYKMPSFNTVANAPDINATINLHVYLVTLKRAFPPSAFNVVTGAITMTPQYTHTQRYDHCLLNTEYFNIHGSRKFKLGHDNAVGDAGTLAAASAFTNEKTIYFNCPRNFRLNDVAGNWRNLQYCPSKTRNYYVLTFLTIPDGTDTLDADERYSVEYNWMITHKLRQLS